MKLSKLFLTVTLVCIASSAGLARAGTLVVNGFNVNGWGSWDTRDPSGVNLRGTSDSLPGNTGTYSGADDAQIAKQMIFMGEGQVVNDASGATPPASPTGSLNGLGYVRLDGTSSNSGKSDISYVNLASGGIASTSALSDPGFSASYTYFPQSNPTSREPGLNLGVTGTDSNSYIFAYVQPTYTPNAWNTASVDSSTSLFTLHGPGAPASNLTLQQWAADATWGPILFGTGADVFRLGFNIGSGQKNGLIYLDYLSTSILNGGNTIDFQAVPEPSTIVLSTLALLGLVGYCCRRSRRSSQSLAA
jgi:hypothetical protein